MLGVLLFGGTSPLIADGGDNSFRTLPAALLSLTVLLTPANFPDVMLPAYNDARGSCIFFVLFLMAGLFFMMNLARHLPDLATARRIWLVRTALLVWQVLTAVFKHYKANALARAADARRRRADALDEAFELLDLSADGYVELGDFSALLERIQRPVFSLFDGRTHSALDTALTKARLQAPRVLPLFPLSRTCCCRSDSNRRHNGRSFCAKMRRFRSTASAATPSTSVCWR